MKAFLLLSTVALAAVGLAAACTDLGVGKGCIDPVDAAATGTRLVSPALECQSRLCLHQDRKSTGDVDRMVCTGFCEKDDDCANATTSMTDKSLCDTGFVCAIATVTGPFCCKKVCLCKGDLQPGQNQDPLDGGVITPPACQPGGSTGSCANLKK